MFITGSLLPPDASKLSDGGWRRKMWSSRKNAPASLRSLERVVRRRIWEPAPDEKGTDRGAKKGGGAGYERGKRHHLDRRWRKGNLIVLEVPRPNLLKRVRNQQTCCYRCQRETHPRHQLTRREHSCPRAEEQKHMPAPKQHEPEQEKRGHRLHGKHPATQTSQERPASYRTEQQQPTVNATSENLRGPMHEDGA